MIPSGTLQIDWELYIRFGCFLGLFLLFAIMELWFPRRASAPIKGRRWFCNISVVALNTIAVRLIFPLMAVDVAYLAQKREWGLLHSFEISYPLAVFIGVVILDFAIYIQHVLFHFVPLFWRIHRMHHADTDIDVTTGTRFHPIEILLSMGIKMGVVAAFGIPVLGVIIFEVLLNASSMFTHSNIRLPLGIDSLVRWIFVTPDMHRVHHSIDWRETNSNFGFNLSVWDRVCGTYKAQPDAGHEKMTIGINDFRESRFLNLGWMLSIPFLTKGSSIPKKGEDDQKGS